MAIATKVFFFSFFSSSSFSFQTIHLVHLIQTKQGVQLIGAHGQDHVTIALALMLEKQFGGWVPPSSSSAAV